MSQETNQSGVEWLISQLQKSKGFQRVINEVNQSSTEVRDVISESLEIERKQRNNLPIKVHHKIPEIEIYIENGVVHVEPNSVIGWEITYPILEGCDYTFKYNGQMFGVSSSEDGIWFCWDAGYIFRERGTIKDEVIQRAKQKWDAYVKEKNIKIFGGNK